MSSDPLSDQAKREGFEQLVTEILFALGDRLDLRDGPDVDEAREAVMRELVAYDGWAADAIRQHREKWRGAVIHWDSNQKLWATIGLEPPGQAAHDETEA